MLAQDNAEGAEEFLLQAATSSGDSAEVWAQLGRADLTLGDSKSAEEAFARALELEPKLGTALIGLIDSLLAQERGDEAIAIIEQRLTGDADNTF